MKGSRPRVSIGLPVYNGEKFLAQALDSILSQSFDDFEVIIADNASTDRTAEICQIYAARDPRICYHCNETNIGAAANFNLTVAMAQGEYFKWAAHDDILDPTFLQRCVDILDSNASTVLVYSKSRIIDEEGKSVLDYDVHLRTDSPRPQDRFHDLLWVTHRCYQVFGMMRLDVLKKTLLIEPYAASDRVLLIGMCLFGDFYEIPDYLFFPRKHATVSVRSHLTRHARMSWFDPSKQGHIVFPAWALLKGYWTAIGRAPLDWHERTYCYRQMGRWMIHKRATLAEDLTIAGKQLAYQVTRRNNHKAAALIVLPGIIAHITIMLLLLLMNLSVFRAVQHDSRIQD